MSGFTFLAVAAVLFTGTRNENGKVAASAEHQATDAPCVLDAIRRRFHANDSLIAELIPCSYEEKICFRYNLLYHPEEDKCRALGEKVRDNCTVEVDRQQFQNGSGHLWGRCAARDRCPGHRMAFDGRCYRKRTVREVLCGCAAPPTPHVLGGAECRCAPRAGYLHVKQPVAARACRVPDLRFPDARRFAAPAPAAAARAAAAAAAKRRAPSARRGPCARRQRACFARGAVWLEHPQGCFPLLERGPCPPGHVVALAGSGWETGCVDTRRGCLPGYKRLLYDQLCHSDRELEIVVPGKVWLGLYGEYEIWDSDVEVRFIPRIINGRCDILVNASASSFSGHQSRAASSATAEGPTAGEARGLEAGQKVHGAPSGLFSFAGERPVTHKSPGGRRPLVTGRWILATSDAVEILDENAFSRISAALQSGVGDQSARKNRGEIFWENE